MPCNIINFTSFGEQNMVLFIKQGVSDDMNNLNNVYCL